MGILATCNQFLQEEQYRKQCAWQPQGLEKNLHEEWISSFCEMMLAFSMTMPIKLPYFSDRMHTQSTNRLQEKEGKVLCPSSTINQNSDAQCFAIV